MGEAIRRLVALVATGSVLAPPHGVAAARSETVATTQQAPAPARLQVRSHNARIVDMIQQGSQRSGTFRTLVTTINAGPDIVYVEEGRCSISVDACLISVSVASDYRIVTILVDPTKDDWDLVGSIGHELFHATEVLGDRQVTNTTRMYALYLRIGHLEPGVGFETAAAIKAGKTISEEFLKYSGDSSGCPLR